MSFLLLSFITVLLPLRAFGHGGIWNYSIAGEWRPGFFPYYPAAGQSSIQRHWTDFRPIVDVSQPTIVCNDPGDFAQEYATIAVGAEVKAYYRGWPHNIGPVIVWMAFCGAEPDSCSSFNGTGRQWFKIGQAGLLSGGMRDGLWAQKHMIANQNFT
ncbi:glycoside hydrolase [Schizothecium vesticola]|uniref:lytic cellulose monooxygenase (C4-dehydrogenating) n=1 Tax=Schizothecium vesticola TaxID=314040 RepID=A0AA40K089_9PEZI|nr:glycoside hydrolase [Schizothecium vesticola]